MVLKGVPTRTLLCRTLVLHIVGSRPSYPLLSTFVHRVWRPTGAVEVFSRKNNRFFPSGSL